MAQDLKWFCKNCQTSGEITVPSGEVSVEILVRRLCEIHERKRTKGGYAAVMFTLTADSGGTVSLQDGVLNLRTPQAGDYPACDLFIFHVQ